MSKESLKLEGLMNSENLTTTEAIRAPYKWMIIMLSALMVSSLVTAIVVDSEVLLKAAVSAFVIFGLVFSRFLFMFVKFSHLVKLWKIEKEIIAYKLKSDEIETDLKKPWVIV